MERTAAAKLINSTFSQEFSRERFADFIRNLLKKFEEKQLPGGRVRTGNYIYEPYRDLVESLDRVGKYTDSEGRSLEVLIVKLKPGQPIDRARTKQRNYAAYYLEHGRDDGSMRDAALVAFVEAGGRSWRFSLVRMEYELKKTDSGKVKSEKTLSPARRFSFLVGEGENTHTARIRFVPLLEDDSKPPTLEEINKAFSVEAITDEFFEQYREIFLQVRDELEALTKKDSTVRNEFAEKGIAVDDFAKKLLGQIVFLYFLQRKGWLGVAEGQPWGTGPRDFLRQLFDKKYADYKNFFNDILEYLFYDMLAVDKGEKAWHEKFNCRIPFLNGGLFEPLFDYDWRKTNILIPNQLFSNRRSATDFDSGSGILDVFDRYNFTVREDEPLEKEVAVDPELLGKVFENLLEVKDRKSKGSYYTPREIVHYMCQESLLSYLESNIKGKVSRLDLGELIRFGDIKSVNDASFIAKEGRSTKYELQLPVAVVNNASEIDELLSKLRVCDPAVGSGAFALGMLNEVVRARYSLNPSLYGRLDGITGRSSYDLKWHSIEHTIYGVDLDPGAVEIAKLRLWLSLIVDEESIETVNPLPNLDYKIMQGNSLLETLERTKLFDESAVSRATRRKSGQMTFGSWADKPKEQLDLELGGRNHLVNEFRRVQHQYFKSSHKSEKEKLRKKLEQVEDRLIETTLSEQKRGDALTLLTKYRRTHFKPYFLWRLNFNEVFAESAGFDIVIANPPYGANLDAKDVPLYLEEFPNSTKGVRDLYKMFIELGISKLVRENGTVCFILPNTFLTQSKYRDIRKFLMDKRIDEIVNLGDGAFNQVVVPTCIIRIAANSDTQSIRYFDIRSRESFGDFSLDGIPIEICREDILASQELLIVPSNRKTAANEVLLGEIAECRDAGIQYAAPGVGRLNKGEAKLGERLLYTGMKPEHPSDIALLVGGDIARWQVENAPSHWLRHNYKSLLKKENGEWFHYTAAIFDSSPRILWRQTSDRIIACEDCSRFWFKKSLHGAIVKEVYSSRVPLRYLLGLLNSAYLNWLYIQMSQETGRVFPQVKISKMKQLPIRIGSDQEIDAIVEVVDQIIAILNKGPRLKLPAPSIERLNSAECRLNDLVFTLYNINSSQVRSISDFFNSQTTKAAALE